MVSCHQTLSCVQTRHFHSCLLNLCARVVHQGQLLMTSDLQLHKVIQMIVGIEQQRPLLAGAETQNETLCYGVRGHVSELELNVTRS